MAVDAHRARHKAAEKAELDDKLALPPAAARRQPHEVSVRNRRSPSHESAAPVLTEIYYRER